MIRWIGERRFNGLDVLWLIVATRALFDGYYLAAGAVAVLGALASAALESSLKRRGETDR